MLQRLRSGGLLRRGLSRAVAVAPLTVDVLLALLVFVLTADQGGGVREFGVFGGLAEPAQSLLGAAAGCLVLLRRRMIAPLLVAGVAVWMVAVAPWGLMVAAYTMSAQPRRSRWYGVVAGAVIALVLLRLLLGTGASAAYAVLLTVLVAVMPLLLGLWVGARRALVATLRERAARLEREHAVMAERARAQERARIAREMHDVVAHRVSLMVVHAGALETTLADDAGARQAGVIRETGREALAELRQVLSVLREAPHSGAPDPQPTLAALDGMIQRSRDAGLPVSMVVEGDRRPLPSAVERAVYRLLQEALTNVHKHAAGAATVVRLCYLPERVEVVVRNSEPSPAPDAELALAGGGQGLLGLRERVGLLDGAFDVGRTSDGGFEVRASLPTAAPT